MPAPERAPAPGPVVEEVVEGGTTFVLPRDRRRPEGKGPAHRAPVFYNPAMALSRDLHVGLVAALSRGLGRRLRVWDMLAASGIRGLRTLTETEGIDRLLATELQPEAVQVVEANFRREGSGRGLARAADALELPTEAPFDLVDLDPYGSPIPFLESALAAIRPGGVLAVTATDMAVLAGPERAACERRYGARPLRTYLCREAGLRILLGAVARAAGRRGRSATPLLAYVRDHHARAYVRFDPLRADAQPPLQVVPFEGYAGPPIAAGRKGGPLWTGPLHDRALLNAIEPPATPARPTELARWLQELREEAGVDVLFYYESGATGKALGLSTQPPLAKVLDGIRAAGFSAARTPFDPSGWRTDAPWVVVERVLRAG